MIGKGKAIAHTKASIQYGWNQEKDAVVVFKQELAGHSPEEITQEFKMLQDQNYHCKKNTLSFVLSPTIEDGKQLNQKELGKICQKFIEQMKLEQRQAIAFAHKDKQHTHIHLYVNRIDYRGKAYNDSFIGKRSQLAAEKVAEQLQLTTVKQVQMEKEFLRSDVRKEIKRRHELTLKQFALNNFDEYIKYMKTNGVQVIPSINKSNQLQGFRFEFNGYNLKGSEVHQSMSGSNIGQRLYGNAKIKELVPLKVLNNTIPVAPGLAKKILEKIVKHAIKKTLDAGLGI
jgi:hypothetical protein